MIIYVKKGQNREVELNVQDSITILDLKKIIKDKCITQTII